MEQVYVLELEGGRYYIGKSADVAKRVKEHAQGKGAGYTSLYKPKKLVEVRTMKSEQDENTLTREYMAKYGVDKVRGGAYAQIALPPETKEVLTRELRGASDACFTCGKHGHFASACPKKKEEIVWVCGECKSEYDTKREAEACCEEPECTRCGRTGHTRAQCYAQSHEDGYALKSTSGHRTGGGTCYRCGHSGHYANDCYASRHRRGYDLDD